LTIRGIGARSPYGSNKIRAYYGDIPLTNGVGETTLEDLELEQIADIEIVKGPASGFYGSGLGGVLLFNPAKSSINQFSQSVSAGSYQSIKYTGKLTVLGKNSIHSLVYSRLHSDGYRENNESNRHNFTWTCSITRNRTEINLLATYTNMFAYIPSSIDWKTFQETPEKAAANWAATKGYEDYDRFYGGISGKQNLSKNWQFRLSTFGHLNRNNELRPFNILQEKNHFLGFRSALEKTYRSTRATLRLIAGNEFFHENYQWQTFQNKNREPGNLLSDNEELCGYNNFFLMADWNRMEKLSVSASLNYNQTHYNYNDHFLTDGDQSGKHRFNPAVSPRLAANWTVSPATRLFTVVSHGFSPPTLEETLMPNGQRNTSIKPETGWNFELGAKAKIGQSIYTEISAYYMKVKNLLVARRTSDDAYMGINAGSTNHPGLELKLDYKLIDRPTWTTYLCTNANLTHYRFDRFMDGTNDYSGNKLTGTPATITNWMLETTHHKGFFANLHYQTVGRMPIRDDNSLYSKAYQLTNLMTGYEKSIGKLLISVSSGIQNLLNVRYASMVLINATAAGNQSPRYYYPGLPRNFKSTVNLKYSF
jgi:iron complex outermembrane receptor protein